MYTSTPFQQSYKTLFIGNWSRSQPSKQFPILVFDNILSLLTREILLHSILNRYPFQNIYGSFQRMIYHLQ